MSEFSNIIDVDEATFEEDVLEQSWDMPVVVDFWAPWCAPCRTLGPMLESLASEPDANFILARVNVDDNPNLSIQHGIRGIPALVLFHHGREMPRLAGARPASGTRGAMGVRWRWITIRSQAAARSSSSGSRGLAASTPMVVSGMGVHESVQTVQAVQPVQN